MAGKFEITKHGDGTFTFELLIDGQSVGLSPVFAKEDECKRGVKAVKKNSRMKVQNALQNDEEKQIRNMSLRLTAIKLNILFIFKPAQSHSAAVQTMRHRLLKLSKKSAITQMPLR